MKKSKTNLDKLFEFLLQEKKTIIFESKQNLINIGIPEVIAKILFEEFGNNAFLIGKWFKEYNLYKFCLLSF